MPLLHLRIFFSFPTRRLFKVMLMLNAVPLGLGLQHRSRSGVGPQVPRVGYPVLLRGGLQTENKFK